ncbi:hypothetical protein ACJDT4_09470 [Clostridium neuense]|uniref:Uncharacterized protein n=1 Tax=Clostridium neuense TaxID=1728934 RepID=A0ABW8TDV2_9CLOT
MLININPKYKKQAIIIVLSVTFMYYLIGRLFKTDELNVIFWHKNEMNISIVAVFLVVITSILITLIVEFIKKHISKGNL